MLVWLLGLIIGGVAIAAATTGVVQYRRLATQVDRLQQEVQEISTQLQRLHRLGEVFTRQIHESQAIETVLGNVLIDKGVLEEQELEDAHRRLIIEPALLDGEHESLIAELPDPAQIRARLVRTLPDTLQ